MPETYPNLRAVATSPAEVSSAVMSSLLEAVAAIRRIKPRRVVVFTGAGVSADSGVPTFRGEHGLWRNHRAEELATPAAFARDPALVWEWYEWRRDLIRKAEPNAAHRAIARLIGATVVTQNVDGLHARAGSREIIELHGNIFRVRCASEGTVSEQREAFPSLPPHCQCTQLLRPDVVWFGESLPEEALARASSRIMSCDLLLIIGTSGVVYPAAGLVPLHRGLSIEINPQTSALAGQSRFAIRGGAAEMTPPIVEAILESSV